MKKIIIIICGLFGIAQAQTTGYSRYDTIRMQKGGGNSELYIENATRGVTGGVFTNQGLGRGAWVLPTTSGTAWQLLGNTGTTAGTNFIGTTDNVDLVGKTNNTERWRSKANGKNFTITSTNTTNINDSSSLFLSTPLMTSGHGITIKAPLLSNGAMINLQSVGTGATGAGSGSTSQRGVYINLSGANAISAQSSYGSYIQNQHTGTTAQNWGLYTEASGGFYNTAGHFVAASANGSAYGTNAAIYATATQGSVNYAGVFDSGYVGIGTIAPIYKLHVQNASGSVSVATIKNTSGGNGLTVAGTSTTAQRVLEILGGASAATDVFNVNANGKIFAPLLPAGAGTKSVRWDATNGFVLGDTTAVTGGTVGGTGTNGQMTKWTGTNTIANALMTDNGSTTIGFPTSAGIFNLGGGATAAELRFLEPSASGPNYSAFKAVAQGSNITYSLPATVGASGTFLRDAAGNGVLDWAAPSGLTNPMTTTGDIIYSSDNSGTPARLGVTTDQDVLTIVSGVPAWQTVSGSYTPTASNVSNCSANFQDVSYLRNGNSVTVFGEVTIYPTLTATTTSFEVSLPFTDAAFDNERYAGGTGWARSIAGAGFAVFSTGGGTTVTVQFVSTDITSQKYNFSFTYFIFHG